MQGSLTERIEQLKALKKDRLQFTATILKDRRQFRDLLDLCFDVNNKTSIRACQILELVCLSKPAWLLPHLEVFTKSIGQPKNSHTIRSLIRVCMFLCEVTFIKKDERFQKMLEEEHLQRITETCFDRLLDNSKVAVKVYAMQCLFYLGKKYDWIHPQLKGILIKDIPNHTPAYKARAKYILQKI